MRYSTLWSFPIDRAVEWAAGYSSSVPVRSTDILCLSLLVLYCQAVDQVVNRCIQLSFSIDRTVDRDLCLITCWAWIYDSIFLHQSLHLKKNSSLSSNQSSNERSNLEQTRLEGKWLVGAPPYTSCSHNSMVHFHEEDIPITIGDEIWHTLRNLLRPRADSRWYELEEFKTFISSTLLPHKSIFEIMKNWCTMMLNIFHRW